MKEKRRKSCLFIDENPFHQALFMKALNDISPQTICITASNCVDALSLMTDQRVIPSYIFVDLEAPHMDAVEFLKEIKQIEELKLIPVVVHAAYAKPHKIIELKEFGAQAIYYRKYEYYGIRNLLHLYLEMSGIQQN